MNWRVLRNVLAIVWIALNVSACSSSKQVAVSQSADLRINESTDVRSRDSVVVAVHDTIMETTTINVQTSEAGDTLRLVQITDRTRARNRAAVKDKEERVVIERDTVYVERKDSVMVHGSGSMVNGYQSGKTALHTTLKWMVALVVAVIILVLVIRFSFR